MKEAGKGSRRRLLKAAAFLGLALFLALLARDIWSFVRHRDYELYLRRPILILLPTGVALLVGAGLFVLSRLGPVGRWRAGLLALLLVGIASPWAVVRSAIRAVAMWQLLPVAIATDAADNRIGMLMLIVVFVGWPFLAAAWGVLAWWLFAKLLKAGPEALAKKREQNVGPDGKR